MTRTAFKSHSYSLRLVLLSIFLTSAVPFSALAEPTVAPDGHYDELFDENGNLRDQYQSLKQRLDQLNKKTEEKFLKTSRLEFQGDNSLNPIPRILTAQESMELRQGVMQRAQALVAFLKDHYSGKKLYATKNIISSKAIDQIIERSGESGYRGLINPETIAFMYGPDIIRDAQGQWRVIEDNPGFIGGVGDLKLAYDLALKYAPELTQELKFTNPMNFYQRLSLALKEQALSRGGKAFIYMVPPYPDKEDSRLQKIFADFDIETITPNTNTKLKITDEGVFAVRQVNGTNYREKVGYLFMNTEHASVDRNHPASRERYLIETASGYLRDSSPKNKLRQEILNVFEKRSETGEIDLDALDALVKRAYTATRNAAPGLMTAILSGKVGSNYSPGVDFIGDKELYVYVEKMIRFYLKQEPILKNIETERMAVAETGRIDTDLVQKIAASPKDYVIKKVDGRGGDSVWVGAKLKKSDMLKVLDLVRESPDLYIAQKYTPLSVLNGQIVDLRSITAVFPNQILVADSPWGRGLPLNGNGKVNLSDQGREVAILSILDRVAGTPMSCRKVHSH